MRPPDTVLRLRQKHAPGPKRDAIADAEKLFAEQSLQGALKGALLACVILNVIWVASTMAFDRFLPWFSIVQGIFIGRAVRHYGRGVDWRFPLLAGGFAVLAAFTGSFLSALFLTGREFDTGALPLIAEISWHTISTFATREFGTVGTIYAGMAAAIAAFFAPRRLERHEAIALRKYRDRERRPDE